MTRRSPAETEHAPTSLPRIRGAITGQMQMVGYDYVDVNVWTVDPKGPLLSSLITTGGHAPVLDVDRPVKVLDPDSPGVGTRLQVPGLTTWRAARIASRLSEHGFTAESFAPAVADLRAQARWHPMRRVTAVFDLNLPLIVLDSKTTGHHHVLVEKAMSWNNAAALMNSLRGVVDQRWATSAGSRTGMLVRTDYGL